MRNHKDHLAYMETQVQAKNRELQEKIMEMEHLHRRYEDTINNLMTTSNI